MIVYHESRRKGTLETLDRNITRHESDQSHEL